MSLKATPEPGTAAGLRRRFDEAFAAPAGSRLERSESLLAIRVGSSPYALRLSEITGLHADLKIVAVPSPVKALLGIAGVRGAMAPIYDLAALLGYPPVSAPRWVAFVRAPEPVGLAFETFESHLQADTSSVEGAVPEARTVGTLPNVRGTVRAAGVLRPIIHLASVVAMLKG
jgi:chemotaxis signal transduction protein